MIPASDRIAKYAAKYSGDVVKTRFDAVEDIALAKQAAQADDWATAEEEWQVIVNTDGVITSDRIKYYNFCREIKTLVNQGVINPTLTSQVINELQGKYETGKGCALATLRKLAALFNVVIP